MIGTDAWVQVVNDEARAERGYRAPNAWRRNVWKEEKDREKANRVAQQVRRAAALTAELAAQSEEKVAVVCDHPPGLSDEVVKHITAPNMRAGGSHPQAEMMQCSPSANPLPSTGNDESPMRRQRRGMKLEKLRKEPGHWRTHAEANQRLQDKEEAWELLQRILGLGATGRD